MTQLWDESLAARLTLVVHRLGDGASFFTGTLPKFLIPEDLFESFWSLHPNDYHVIMIHGRPVKTPRWQQAYGADYHYTGRVNRAIPVPENLEPIVSWSQASIDPRLNGMLLNWYDGSLGHYIGRHRDSIKNMVPGAPIVTISLGESRTFRLRRWKGNAIHDFCADHGTVFVMPFETNRSWTHEVLRRKAERGRRISITLRAFR